MSATPEPARVVHLLAPAFSGATWFSLMLGAHSEVFGTGELYKIFDWERPSCTVHGEGCPFWSGFEECARSDLLSRIAARSGRSTILVTNSRKQLDGVSVLPPDVQVRYLWLVRDGRAVTASMLRKQAVSGMSAAVNDWARAIRKHQRFLRTIASEDHLTLRYEDAVEDPTAMLGRVCAFLGLEFEPAMLWFWEHPQHYIGGNRGTLLSMLRQRGDDTAPVLISSEQASVFDWQKDLEYYRSVDVTDRFVDHRWMTELSAWQKLVFRVRAGRLNRRLGY